MPGRLREVLQESAIAMIAGKLPRRGQGSGGPVDFSDDPGHGLNQFLVLVSQKESLDEDHFFLIEQSVSF